MPRRPPQDFHRGLGVQVLRLSDDESFDSHRPAANLDIRDRSYHHFMTPDARLHVQTANPIGRAQHLSNALSGMTGTPRKQNERFILIPHGTFHSDRPVFLNWIKYFTHCTVKSSKKVSFFADFIGKLCNLHKKTWR
jgi:hypothetical protein